mmetsp:Transcript_5565/g.7242  ORF Transcript_5565/g.7242 Transcript_5565/m.7242 type:complete len:261 (-) Transcript_5565:565-1347(-)
MCLGLLGKNIQRAQYIFVFFHSIVVALVLACFRIVRREKSDRGSVPFWVGIILITSRRIHSIFALRLFNDCVAMVLVYFAIYLFVKRKWVAGVVMYSLATSIKMNVILFAPGLAVFLIQSNGFLVSVLYGAIFAAIQLILAIPFLLENPGGYIGRAVDIGRVFLFKWTVNYKFLPVEIFQSKELHIALALSVMITWLAFGHFKWSKQDGGLVRLVINNFTRKRKTVNDGDLADHILTCLFVSNFIGIVFWRSLHYQFYCW